MNQHDTAISGVHHCKLRPLHFKGLNHAPTPQFMIVRHNIYSSHKTSEFDLFICKLLSFVYFFKMKSLFYPIPFSYNVKI